MIINLVYFRYQCAICGTEFKAVELPPNVYGEFLLRSFKTRQEAYLNALQDDVFTEFDKLVKTSVSARGLSPEKLGKAVQATFSIACDESSDGSKFAIGLDPRCPKCGSEKMKSWSLIEPVEATQKDLKPITHNAWRKVPLEEKRNAVDMAINTFVGGITH